MMELISMLQDAAAEAQKLASAGSINGSITLGLAGAGAGLAIGLIGFGAASAVGRNPGAFGNILTLGIIAMALAEGLGILSFILGK